MTDQQAFQILQISSFSDHPVRNSSKEFIFGNQILWDTSKTYVDGDGSIAPNVFSYDFTSPLASNSTLNVTIKIINQEILKKGFFLHGFLDGKKVFQNQVPVAQRVKNAITVPVCVVQPDSSPNPVAFTGDFTWKIAPKEHNLSSDQIVYASADKTRLELYWISPDIHEIFYAISSGITIDFLRSVFESALLFDDWPEVTRQVFSGFSKIYDTIEGASHFDVTPSGGDFDYELYIAKETPNSPPGSKSRIVNCYDQTAMVQVLGTINGKRPTWLRIKPFGFIKETNLVGVGRCNNPFFESNNTKPVIDDPQDPERTSFRDHTFNGLLPIFVIPGDSDRMYDATCGPSLGEQNAEKYVESSIDEKRTPFGTVENITQRYGVADTVSVAPSLPDDVDGEKLLQRYATGNAKPHSQVHWDDVSQWVNTVLGDSCDVTYQKIKLKNGVATTFWSLSGLDGIEGEVFVKAKVETRIGANEALDYERSSRASFNDLLVTLTDVELDLGPNYENLYNIWTPAPFGDYAKYALQYAPHITKGRVLLVSGNALIDISGGSSSSALEPLVRKLLTHTTVPTISRSLHIPYVPDYLYHITDENQGPNSPNEVKGLTIPFDVKCQVDDLVTVVTAHVEGHGILLSKHKVEINEVKKTSTVTFTFVARKVGVHDIDLHFGQALTMNTGTKKIQVTVVNEW